MSQALPLYTESRPKPPSLSKPTASLTPLLVWLFADFRISKYCDEHLIIGNEDQWERRRSNGARDVSGDPTAASSSESDVNEESPAQHHRPQDSGGGGGGGGTGGGTSAGRNYYNDNTNDPVGFAEDRRRQRNFYDYDDDEDDDDDQGYDDEDEGDGEEYGRAEPRAEALQQLPMVQQMHSFHNLKILKTFPSESAPINETEQQRKLEAEAAYRKRQKVFSQVSGLRWDHGGKHIKHA